MRATWLLFAMACTTPAQVGTGTGTTTGSGGTTERTCEQVKSDLGDELDRVQSCTEPEQCGQAITGTSCGCTRDLVARNDADLQGFRDLVDEGQALECELGFTSVCDCPPADGFACVEGTCAWNYVDPPEPLPACTAADGADYALTKMSIELAELVVGVEYSGGCAEHDFTLCWPDQTFQETVPLGARLELRHDTPGDPCDAVIQEEVRFSLLPLAEAWELQGGGGPREIQVHVGDFSELFTW